jgi:dipeptidyl aminopeptidase/acylaminoacyl peptidase
MKRYLIGGLLAALCSSVHAQDAAPAANPVIENLIRPSQFLDVRISPTGEYLAATVMATEDTGSLVVLRMSDMKMTGNFKLAGRSFVGGFEWASDERLVFTVAKSDGAKTNPGLTGEIYAMNWDGKRQELLIGPRKDGRAGFIEDMLEANDKFILVSVYDSGNREGTYPTLERMNISTGARTVVARAPILNASFLADHDGKARFAWGDTIDLKQRVFYRAAAGGEWEVVNDEAASNQRWTPLAFSKDGARVYLQASQPTGPDAIESMDIATRERTRVARDDNVDPMGLLFAFDRIEPIGVAYMDGLPRTEYFDIEQPDIAVRRSLEASFKGQWLSINSATRDQRKLVLRVRSDRNPGEFFLFDRDERKATYLLSTREWIEPDKMAPMKPISYTARDGLVIHGYLTLPPGSDGKKLPLVINPHGGPIGPFDAWGFNADVQILAQHGYAVLQVNFRGSGNYGDAFTRAGYRQWGGGMIDDMSDGVDWAIAQGIADPARVCIYGASYGGYAAAMSLVREPQRYQCGVGYVGVYDMPMMYTRGDIPDRDAGKNFLAETLGSGQDGLKAISPVHQVAKIEDPIFIIVGNDDFRAHPDHSRALRRALADAGKPHEWMERDFEGHGYFKVENNRALYTQMLAFLDRYIGPKAGGSTGAGGSGAP